MQPFDLLWPYLVIMGWLFVTGIGLPPLPEELPIILAGIAASQKDVYWFLAWPSCIVGVVAADLVLYWAGRWWGTSLFKYRWVQRFLPDHRRQKIEEGFHQQGWKILSSGRMLPGLRTGVFLTAGALRYPFLRFLVVDGIIAILTTGLIFFASYSLAAAVMQIVDQVHKVQYWLLAVALLAAGGYGLYRYFRVAREHVAHDDLRLPTLPELMHSKHPHEEAQGKGVHAPAITPSTNSTTASPAASGSHPAAKPE